MKELTQAIEALKMLQNLTKSTESNESKPHRDIGKKVIIRTYSAGVHYGTLVEKNGKEVILEKAIRIWYWKGANSLSQLAMDGTRNPDECKFSVPVDHITIEMIEIIPCTKEAIRSIEGVKSWAQ